MKWKNKKQLIKIKGDRRIIKSFAWIPKTCNVDDCQIWLTFYWNHQEWDGRKWITIYINGNA